MFKSIISFSLKNKLVVGIGVLMLIILGSYSATQIPLDAVPDITNNQVQIVTTAPTFAPEEVEQLITYPLESGMTNIPNVIEVRSISRYGLSVITIVFEESVELMLARQYVQEQLQTATSDLPKGITPELMPITTGLGEIYQYVLVVADSVAHKYDATNLRTIQDWIVKRQLNGTKGIIETSSFGGYLKQYEVAIRPEQLKTYKLDVQSVIQALEKNNENSGGSYIEQGSYSYYIRTEGRVNSLEAIGAIPVSNQAGTPILMRDIADIRIGSAKRYGAMTMDGNGEVVGGITLMLKGGNSSQALENVKERIAIIQASLPEGVSIYPYLDRSKLIGKTIHTASNNLIEGGIIVILVLLLLLGNFRAGLIVASVIPLSMLFALSMMNAFGVSANLMSLGAIDFGIVIDGAVIIVESLLYTLSLTYVGQKLTQTQMNEIVFESTNRIYRSAAFGVLIILVVFVPILTLEGTEGKTFRPMAQTVGFAILGSMILSLTYIPVMTSLFLNKTIKEESGIAHRIIHFLQKGYRPILRTSLNYAIGTIAIGALAFAFSVVVFSRMGAEFIPTLEEGDIAMQQSIKPGSSLQESIQTASMAEKILLQNFPEVEHVVSKIGTAEVPTDPMAIEDADVMIILKDKSEWTSADNREDLIDLMKEKLAPITWASYEFTQPIQLRFNELMTGAKSDIAVKIFGEQVDLLKAKADEAADLIQTIQGAADVKVDQTEGLQQLSIQFRYDRMAQYGVSVADVNQIVRAAYAGEQVGRVYEEERRFDLVVRLTPARRAQLDLQQLSITAADGRQIPLSELAEIVPKSSPMLISREQARRFINIGINVRDRDVASLVQDIQQKLETSLQLPPGYEIQYGGQFENLENARNRLLIAVPVALGLILFLLYLAFRSAKDVLIIFMAVPLSAIGGIWALELRGMPFSISSGIGFIALFGISVLNGIVLISAIRQLEFDKYDSFKDLISQASLSRLRPVLLTALVAAFGFLPMAISTGNGAEVQQPLATVVIGGLISSTLLTLLVLPSLYYLFYKKQYGLKVLLPLLLAIGAFGESQAQTFTSFEEIYEHALEHHPQLQNQELQTQIQGLEQQKIGQWDPLQVDYQGGQINASDFDHFFTINQNLNHFFGRQKKKTLIAGQQQQLAFDKVLIANELKYSLRKVYDQWAAAQQQYELADSIRLLYQQLDPIVQLRFEAGETSQLDVRLFRTALLELEETCRKHEQQLQLYRSELQRMALLPQGTQLENAVINLLPTTQFELDTATSIYLETYRLKQQVLAKELAVIEQSAKLPDLSIGYFAQSLEKDFAFQGVQLGIGIPLDRRSAKTSRTQFDLETQQVNNSRKATLQQYQERIQMLRKQQVLLATSVENYQQQLLPEHQRLLELARLQYEQGEIDLLALSQMQEKELLARQQYIDLLLQANAVILELTYLTQKK
ncbi:MAG: CusA/CzcA family heavy metal efflux RND transporter [Saprospiraceae bacterium]|nr:CusA/CzcA family heavy metal efflux RND transporter [Saprospiraceae bacterium]